MFFSICRLICFALIKEKKHKTCVLMFVHFPQFQHIVSQVKELAGRRLIKGAVKLPTTILTSGLF